MEIELPDSTVEVEVAGGTTQVHYTQFHAGHFEIDEFADRIADALVEYDGVTVEDSVVTTEQDFEGRPMLSEVLFEVLGFEFWREVYDEEGYEPTPVYEHLKNHDEGYWRHMDYDGEEPSVTDVVGALMCLVNASRADTEFRESEGEESMAIFSEEFFQNDIRMGLMLAFRDAHVYGSPKNPFNPAFLSDRERAVADAIENVMGIELSDRELHALLLSQQNKNTCLQSASSKGKQEFVETGMDALSDLTEAMKAENEEG